MISRCSKCDGRGFDGWNRSLCTVCNGKGTIRSMMMWNKVNPDNTIISECGNYVIRFISENDIWDLRTVKGDLIMSGRLKEVKEAARALRAQNISNSYHNFLNRLLERLSDQGISVAFCFSSTDSWCVYDKNSTTYPIPVCSGTEEKVLDYLLTRLKDP